MTTSNIFSNWDDTHSVLWGNAPIRLAHNMHKSPLFSMDQLAQLIEQYPREHYSLMQTGMKDGHKDDEHSNQQRANEWNEFKDSGYEAQYQRTGNTQQGESNRADNSDKHASGQLSSDIGCQRTADILKKLVPAPAPTSARKHL